MGGKVSLGVAIHCHPDPTPSIALIVAGPWLGVLLVPLTLLVLLVRIRRKRKR